MDASRSESGQLHAGGDPVLVVARQWERGWELFLDRRVVTQVASLGGAEQQIRDYLDTVDPEADHAHWEITVAVESHPKGGVDDRA
ncbi:hypothetical protein [Microbacterium aurum]